MNILSTLLASGSSSLHSFHSNHSLELIGTILFGLAVLHTFNVKNFLKLAAKFRHRSIAHNICHLLGEIEVVFGFWAFIFIIFMHLTTGRSNVLAYLEQEVNYTEAGFVFVVMCMAASAPVIHLAEVFIKKVASLIPTKPNRAFFLAVLIVGPILGSFITEPAAMTVTALLLRKNLMKGGLSYTFRYAIIGLLFVNISIGGTLSNFAAPPVLMVATPWEWSITHMFLNFGWKAIISILICTITIMMVFRKELDDCPIGSKEDSDKPLPSKPTKIVTIIHVVLLAIVIINSHHITVFIGVFLLFLGWCVASEEFQSELSIEESLLVGFFLAGLVTLGPMQTWWLKPILESFDANTLFVTTTALTGITDNAAITYLGTLVELDAAQKYSLVSGAVAGGGLSVIANAPNPAGFGILKERFGKNGISPIRLLGASIGPTIVASICFMVLPNLYKEEIIATPYSTNMSELLKNNKGVVDVHLTTDDTIKIGTDEFIIENPKEWQSWLDTFIPYFCENNLEHRTIIVHSISGKPASITQELVTHIRGIEKVINTKRNDTAIIQGRNYSQLPPTKIIMTGDFGIINKLGEFNIHINGTLEILDVDKSSEDSKH